MEVAMKVLINNPRGKRGDASELPVGPCNYCPGCNAGDDAVCKDWLYNEDGSVPELYNVWCGCLECFGQWKTLDGYRNTLKFSKRDSEKFLDALRNPEEPNEALKKAVKMHDKDVEDKTSDEDLQDLIDELNAMLDDLVDKWHNSKYTEPINEYLGMTCKEYCDWVEDPDKFLKKILNVIDDKVIEEENNRVRDMNKEKAKCWYCGDTECEGLHTCPGYSVEFDKIANDKKNRKVFGRLRAEKSNANDDILIISGTDFGIKEQFRLKDEDARNIYEDLKKLYDKDHINNKGDNGAGDQKSFNLFSSEKSPRKSFSFLHKYCRNIYARYCKIIQQIIGE